MKKTVECPNSGKDMLIEDLLSPYIFTKEKLEYLVNNGKDFNDCFKNFLDKVNEQVGKGIDTISREVVF